MSTVGGWRRSSYCANGSCLEWNRSTYCSSGGCVETCAHEGQVLVRDSKLNGGVDSPILSFAPRAWAEFVVAVNDGEFQR